MISLPKDGTAIRLLPHLRLEPVPFFPYCVETCNSRQSSGMVNRLPDLLPDALSRHGRMLQNLLRNS
jgi:hypothetical protein